MNITKTVALGAFLASALAGGAFAKGHDNGFGAGAKGAAAGMVDEGVTNREGDGSGTTYGSVVREEAMAGERDKSELAQDRDADTHPSNRSQ